MKYSDIKPIKIAQNRFFVGDTIVSRDGCRFYTVLDANDYVGTVSPGAIYVESIGYLEIGSGVKSTKKKPKMTIRHKPMKLYKGEL